MIDKYLALVDQLPVAKTVKNTVLRRLYIVTLWLTVLPLTFALLGTEYAYTLTRSEARNTIKAW